MIGGRSGGGALNPAGPFLMGLRANVFFMASDMFEMSITGAGGVCGTAEGS